MTKNRQVFLNDPTQFTIPNAGVAEVVAPQTQEQWKVLRYELESFVCDGEYRNGLERILSSYLFSLDKPKQPAAWVSGFYGSGKSHLVRALEYLWRDVSFPDGARARGLTKLPTEIADLFKELSTVSKREGGLWSAAGKLGASRGSVRLALLSIVLQSAGLPEQYAPARFVIWLKQNGYYEAVRAGVESNGKTWETELNNMYVSPVLTESLLKVYPQFATSAAEARSLLKAQYPPQQDDISDDELLRAMHDVMALQSTSPGKLPCTLLIFDELQQFIGDDTSRTLQVQNVVEACCSQFGSKLLFVATGQAALQATTQLSKLQGRFTVRVTLADTDVEKVVREVVLRKSPAQVPLLKSVLDSARGEIDRQLAGTKIGPSQDDLGDLVPDYPLLPVRRRFWERALRAIDEAGTAGQLRTQLQMVHEAARAIADRPVGTVVAADVLYDQQKTSMLQGGILPRDIATAIDEQNNGTPDGKLRARLCALAFLISKLPAEGPAATGIRANADMLADLLVEDLTTGSDPLRQRIPSLLKELVESGRLMLVGDEYRLQTREGAAWEDDYRKRYARIKDDDSRIAADRAKEFRDAVSAALKEIKLTQGASKTPRKIELHFGADAPDVDSGAVPIWVRDEWSVSERTVRDDAQAAGVDSPLVFVFLPKREADALKAALAGYAAAKESVDSRPTPATPEGIEAKNAMQTRVGMERIKLDAHVGDIVSNARVFQAGGNEVSESTFQASVRSAVEAALVRLFPKFDLADHLKWDVVLKRAGEGAADALAAIGYVGEVEKHPACQEVRSFVGSAGKKGGEVRKRFMGAEYGWPQDGVDGVLMTLIAGGLVRATKDSQPLTPKQIIQSQIGVIQFFSEGVTVSGIQRIGVRKLLSDLGLSYKTGDDAAAVPLVLSKLIDLAQSVGGQPPLPERPSIATIESLQSLGGNEQLVAVYERREELLNNFKAWTQAGNKIVQRMPRWQTLQRLLHHADGLPVVAQVKPQLEAIRVDRSLLTDPDPLSPLNQTLTAALRSALQTARQRLVEIRDREMTALEASQEWRSLPPGDRQRISATNMLGLVPELKIGTDDELLATLDAMPLSEWEDRAAALPGRVANARDEAIKLLAPKAVRVSPRKATLTSTDEVDKYLAELRAEIIAHIEAGKPVIL